MSDTAACKHREGGGVGRIILSASAIVLFVIGAAGLFAPQEVSGALDPVTAHPLIMQIGASALLGFALLNWMSRSNRLGGIYGRPLGIANLLLFAASSLSIWKAAAHEAMPIAVIAMSAVFSALAIAFAWLIFASDPLRGSAPRPEA